MKDTGNRFKNLNGEVFGKLTVLDVAGKDVYGKYKWECICECGAILTVLSRSLLSGNTKSCGCFLIKGILHGGVGVYEVGVYKTSLNGRTTKEYSLWRDMLRRCYDEKTKQVQPNYLMCSSSDSFKNFQLFAGWCNIQKGFNEPDWQLDKDLLGDGLTYSEGTCCFLPREVNLSLRKAKGVYMLASGKYTANYGGKHLGTFITSDLAKDAYLLKWKQNLRWLLDKYSINLCGSAITKLEELCDLNPVI